MSDPSSAAEACAAPPRDRKRELLAALAVLCVYAALASWELRGVLSPDMVLTPGAFIARGGPFSDDFRALVPEGIDFLADTSRQFTPWLRYAADHWEQDGELPLWKSSAACGAPLVGNGQSALFFPTRLLALLLGAPAWVHAAIAWLRLVVAAFGGYLLLRHLRASVVGAFVGGLVFGFGGFLVAFRFHPHADVAALLPWLALAADRLVLRPSARRVGAVALLAGLQWLAGHPQTAVHAQATVALLVIARVWSRRREADGPGLARPLLALGAALLLGLALAAIQLAPLGEYASLSESAQLRDVGRRFPILDQPLWGGAFVAALALAGFALVALARGRRVLLSALLLLAATAGALLAGLQCGLTEAFLMPLCADWFGAPNSFLGPLNFVESNGAFVGAALPLCAAGLLFGQSRGVVRAAAVCAVVGLLAGLRAPVLMELLRVLPVMGLMDNGRVVLIGLLGFSVLAGLGVDGLRHAVAWPAARARLAALLLAPTLAVFGVLVWGVRTGAIESKDSPATRRAPLEMSRVGLLDGTLEPWVRKVEQHDPLARRLKDPRSGPDDMTVLGFFALRGPARGMRLLYGRRATVATSRWAPVKGDSLLAGFESILSASIPPGWTVYVFRSSFPRDSLPAEVPMLALEVTSDDGLTKSALLRAREPTRDATLLFPARPAPTGDPALQLILLGVAALGVVIACGAGARTQAVAAVALPALAAASLLPFGESLAPALPRAFFYPRSGAYEIPASAWPEHRVLCMDIHSLSAEVPTAYGIHDVRNYDALVEPRIAQLLRAALDLPLRRTPMEELPARRDPDLLLLGLMGVSLVMDWDDAPAELQRIPWPGNPGVVEHFALVENPLALPRARLVSRATLQPEDVRALTLLRAAAFDRIDAAVLADAQGVPESLLVPEEDVLDVKVGASAARPGADEPGAAGTAHIAFDTPDRVQVAIEPAAPALLLLADTAFPGWHAYVDGVERPVLRANLAFRAVPVAPGERSVEFRYEPLSFTIGKWVSAASLLLLLGLLLVRRRAPAHTSPG